MLRGAQQSLEPLPGSFESNSISINRQLLQKSRLKLTVLRSLGVLSSRSRDGHFHGPHCAYAFHLEAQALYFLGRKPYSGQNTVWNEGKDSTNITEEWH